MAIRRKLQRRIMISNKTIDGMMQNTNSYLDLIMNNIILLMEVLDIEEFEFKSISDNYKIVDNKMIINKIYEGRMEHYFRELTINRILNE